MSVLCRKEATLRKETREKIMGGKYRLDKRPAIYVVCLSIRSLPDPRQCRKAQRVTEKFLEANSTE
jgi:hypothetical protein